MVNEPYFPLDLHLDIKMEYIEAEFGITGFGVIVKLWQYIYATEGYYTEWTEDVMLMFAKRIGVSINTVSEIVKAALRRDVFDKGLFEKYNILTSKGVQKRHFNMLKRHKEVTVISNYLLVDVTQFLKNVSITMENVNIQSENVNISDQIRLDKIRLDNSILEVEEKKGTAAATDVLHTYEKYIGLVTPQVVDGIDIFIIKKGMDPELIIRIIEYACEQGKRSWQYINKAIMGNLKDNILTLDAYNRHQADRTKSKGDKVKSSKFNNYDDANKGDYAELEEQILDMMLEDEY